MNNPKIPPQNLEAEESVLGALMIDNAAIFKVADILSVEDFYKPAHAKVYSVMMKLFEKSTPIDILSVKTKLEEAGAFQDIGGSSFLTKLMESVPTASHVEHYAKTVKDKRILRDLISASAQITEDSFNLTTDVEVALDKVEQKIFNIARNYSWQRFADIKSLLPEAIERMEKMHSGDGSMRGVRTGFHQLDNILSGLQRSDLIVLGARPSLGKTSLALDIARHVATKEKKAVGIFSLEMSKDQVIDRLISAEANIPLWKLRTGRLKDDLDFQMIQSAIDTLSSAPIFIDDTSSPNVLQMRAMARRLQMQAGQDLGLIVVDYLQLIHSHTTSDNMVQQITEISRGLKGLARDLNVPVLALSQLSRGVEQRDVKVPRLADLRDSGSIEQDSDVVMFIYRKDRDKVAVNPEEENLAEIIVAKHRNGPLGTVKLKFDAEKASFKSIDAQHGL